MKQYFPIYLYGVFIVIGGIFLLFSANNPFNFIRMTTGIILIIGAIIASYAAFTLRRNHVQFAYHEMHALAMLVYGISILAISKTTEKFISLTSYLFIFYSLSEIIFCFWLFNLEQKIVPKIVLIRLILGLGIGVGTMVANYYPAFQMECFGILFILVGVNILLYGPVVKTNKEITAAPDSQTALGTGKK